MLITEDKDFGELVHREAKLAIGVLFLRLSRLDPEDRATLVAQLVRTRGDSLRHAFCVLTPTSVRIRPLLM